MHHGTLGRGCLLLGIAVAYKVFPLELAQSALAWALKHRHQSHDGHANASAGLELAPGRDIVAPPPVRKSMGQRMGP